MQPSLSDARHLYLRAVKNAKRKSKEALHLARRHEHLLTRSQKSASAARRLAPLLKESEKSLVYGADVLDIATYELSQFYAAAIEVGEDEAATIYELLDSLEFLSVHCRREANHADLPDAAYLLLAERLAN